MARIEYADEIAKFKIVMDDGSEIYCNDIVLKKDGEIYDVE